MPTQFPFIAAQSNGRAIEDFQVFGQRCSGTNYLDHLVAANFKAQAIYHYGWKHGVPSMPGIAAHSLILAVVRDPLEWLASLLASALRN